MRIVIVSDTHNRLSQINIPDGDVLVHCGDFCSQGKMAEVEQFSREFAELPHKHKIVVAGNHDWPLERDPERARAQLANFTYLEDEGVEIGGYKFYGSPWQPEFMSWAFNLPRQSNDLSNKWQAIPIGVDVLVTHSPPYGILDRTKHGFSAGCELLLERIAVVKPRIHCFGHIHEAYGQQQIDETLFINAAVLDASYRPANQPVVIDLS